MTPETVAGESAPAEAPPKLLPNTATAALSVAGLGALLTIAFFPMLFSRVKNYDDEGAFLVTLRQFMDHGSLYEHTHGAYGPFYYSFFGLLFRLSGHSPTPFTGRLIVLGLTVLAAAFFAATVWRVTRSLAFTLLAEIATYTVLIRIAGNEPTHPGSLIVLVLSVLLYGLASYALEPSTKYLVIVGIAVGALLMCKINVGLFAAAGIIIAFVVGNRRYTRSWRRLVAFGGVALPFVLMVQKLYEIEMAEFALLVALGVLLSYAPLHFDVIELPRRALAVMGISAIAPMVVSMLWPLANGTSPTNLVLGVFIRPLGQADHLASQPTVSLQLFALLVTLCIAYAAFMHRGGSEVRPFGPAWLPNAALGVSAVYVLALGLLSAASSFLAWLPAIALIPALAWLSELPPKLRLVLRLLLPVAILQILHAYPVAGSQRAWGLVAICVPCAIAMAVAAERIPLWQLATRSARALIIGALALLLVIGSGVWPLDAWQAYNSATPLKLPGTGSIRIDTATVAELTDLTHVVKKRCDTFYSAPGFDSLYIYTGLPTPTGLLANWPGVLSDKEQRELASQLATLQAKGERVCIVRDLLRQKEWLSSSYGKGPLGKALAPYKIRVGRVGHYSVSVLKSPFVPSS